MKADGWGGLGGPVRTVASFWGAARAVGEMRLAHPIQVFYALRLGSLAAQVARVACVQGVCGEGGLAQRS
ncbi:hypothetical protein XAP6164_2700001 [Xanthomonas phaseoli pv. phaseoli]|nr:hypothetical protein XAP6164_2700001 [Xanthomonas phaseoli pv. phaseoli]